MEVKLLISASGRQIFVFSSFSELAARGKIWISIHTLPHEWGLEASRKVAHTMKKREKRGLLHTYSYATKLKIMLQWRRKMWGPPEIGTEEVVEGKCKEKLSYHCVPHRTTGSLLGVPPLSLLLWKREELGGPGSLLGSPADTWHTACSGLPHPEGTVRQGVGGTFLMLRLLQLYSSHYILSCVQN